MSDFRSLFKPTFLIFLFPLFSFQSSLTQNQYEYRGTWQAEDTKVTVRMKTGWMKYSFISHKLLLTLKIDSDDKASGSIGAARFENVLIRRNKGNPSITGILYIIRCEALGKLFENDPLPRKTVELWLKPITKNGKLTAEIRLRDGWEPFPMGECNFLKQLNEK